MYACDTERAREHDAQPAVLGERAAVGLEPAHPGEHAAAHGDDRLGQERRRQSRHHRDVAAEQMVGHRLGGQGERHQRRGKYGSGQHRGAAHDGNDALAQLLAARNEPDQLLLDGGEQADTEHEDDRPEHRQGGLAGRGGAVVGDGELGVGAGPEYCEPGTHHERPRRQQAQGPGRELHRRLSASSSVKNARPRYSTALAGDLLGTPANRGRMATGTWLTRYPRRSTRSTVSAVAPRYSTGYQSANNSISARSHARNPDVVSVSLHLAILDSTNESMTMDQRRGPWT